MKKKEHKANEGEARILRMTELLQRLTIAIKTMKPEEANDIFIQCSKELGWLDDFVKGEQLESYIMTSKELDRQFIYYLLQFQQTLLDIHKVSESLMKPDKDEV